MPKRSSRWPLILPVFVKILRVSAFISFLLPSVLWADLSVNDTLNKYTLYGRKGISIGDAANTAKDTSFKGAWVGSDSIIDLKGHNNIWSTITTKELVFEGNGQDTVMGKTDVRDSLSVIGAANIFHGIVNVEKSAYLAQYDSLQKGLYIGNGPVRVNLWALGHVWEGHPISKDFWNTKTSRISSDGLIPGVHWNDVQPHEPYGMSFPDTTISTVGTTNVGGSNNVIWDNKTFQCGFQQTLTGKSLSLAQCQDTVLSEEGGSVGVLQPGNYGDLSLSTGTTIYLTEGVYSFHSITMAAGGTRPTMLLSLQPHGKRTIVYIRNSLSISATNANVRSVIAPSRAVNYANRTSKAYGTDSTQFAGGSMMVYSEAADLTLNNYLDLWATVTAPSNTVYVKEGFHLYGQIFADSIAIDNNFRGTDGAFIPWYPDRPKVNFSGVVAASVDEKDLKADGMPDTSWATITISMNHINGDPITVWYHTIDSNATGSAAHGSSANGTLDYVTVKDSLVIPATSLSGTIRIPVLGDNIHEGDEFFKVKIDSIRNADLGSRDTAKISDSIAVVRIIDNDNMLFVRLIPDSSGPRSLVRSVSDTQVFKYRLQIYDTAGVGKVTPAATPVSVRLKIVELPEDSAYAVVGRDYVLDSVDYTFASMNGSSRGDSDLAVIVKIPPTTQFAPTFCIRLALDSVHGSHSLDSVVVDTVYSFAAHLVLRGGSAPNDGTKPLPMRVQLLNSATGTPVSSRVPLAYSWSTLDGSAVAGQHFVGDTAKADTLIAGSFYDSLTVAILASSAYDSTRHFRAVLTPVSVYAGLATAKDTAIDTLTCSFGKPTISMPDMSVQRQAADIILKLPVRLSRFNVLNPVYSFAAADGGAVNGTDYVLKPGTDSITSTDTISITIKGGTYFDTARSFWVTLPSYDTSALATVAQGSDTVAKITITSPVTSVRLLVDDAAAARSSDASIVFPVRVVDASDTARRVTTRVALPFTWSTVDGSAIAGREFKGDTAAAGTVLAGDSGTSLAVTVLHTAAYDSTRHFQVVTVPGSLVGLSTIPDTAVGTLRNGNAQPLAYFPIPSWVVNETPERIHWIPVRLSGPVAVAETLLVSADVSGSAALAGRDYVLLQPSDGGLDTTLVSTNSVKNVQLVVPAGDSLVWVPLLVLRDSLDKLDHHVRLRLALASGLAPVDTARDTSTVTFLNTDASVVSFWKDTLTVKDVDGAATIQLLLDIASHVATQASVATLASVHDLGLAGDSSVALSFASGNTSASFVLTWGNDHKVGSDRVFDLHLVGLQGLVRGVDSVLHVRIINTNVAPVVKITSPADSARLGKKNLDSLGKVPVTWNVDGKAQTPYDTLLPEGKSTISKCYTDAWGNIGCDSVHVWLDTTAPKVVIDSVSKDGGKTWVAIDTPWVNVPGVLVKWHSIDGGATTWHQDTAKLTDTLNTVTRCIEDAVGNKGCGSGLVGFDTIPPKVWITTPPNGSQWPLGCVSVIYYVQDRGVTTQHDTTYCSEVLGPHTIKTPIYIDRAGNAASGSTTITMVPNTPTSAKYIDSDGDGRIDEVIVQFPTKVVGNLPNFDISYNTPGANTISSSVVSYGSSSQAGSFYVVKGDTLRDASGKLIRVVEGRPVLDSDGHQLVDSTGHPLYASSSGTPLLNANGKPVRDTNGIPLWIAGTAGSVDSSVLVVKLSTPFPYGWTSSSVTDLGVIKGTNTALVNGQSVQQAWKDTFDIQDGVAPVITKSEVHRAESYSGKDTLWLYPSEPIALDGKGNTGVFQVSLDSGRTWIDVPVASTTSSGALQVILNLGSGVKPGVLVRFGESVSDASGNRVHLGHDTARVVVMGPARPGLVQVGLDVPVIQPSSSSSSSSNLKGGFAFLASSGDTSAASMKSYLPGQGYASSSSVSDVCPDLADCAAISMYINQNSTVQLYVYDHLGTFVAGTDFIVTKSDLASLSKDGLERSRLKILWNLRDAKGEQVVSGIYLIHIVVRHDTYESATSPLENYILKLGVKK